MPPYPGITSAMGLLTSDLKYDQMRTVFMIEGAIDAGAARPRPRGLEAESCAGGCARTASPTRTIEVAPRARLPLRRPGLRAAGPADRRTLHRGGAGGVPPPARAGVRPRLPATRSRSSTCASPPSAGGRGSSGCRRARTAATPLLGEGESRLRAAGSCTLPTRYYERCAAPARRADRRPGRRLPARHDHRRPAGLDRARRRAPATFSLGRRARRVVTAVRTRVDPITAAVIAGALESIAVEMGHKLARMSYSSIIRESEDFGCVICDAQARQLARVVAVDAAPVRARSPATSAASTAASRSSARSGSPATSSSTTTPTTAPRTSPTSASSCPSSTAASSSASRRRPRTTSTSARSRPAPAGSSTRPTRTPRASSSTRSRSRRRAAATSGSGGSSATTSRRAARRRRHGGAGRRLPDRRRALRGADRALRDRDRAGARART